MAHLSEANLQRLIMLALSGSGCVVWRNNVGAYKDPKSGAFIRYGVGSNGGSDLIGITPDGRFLAVEVKTKTGKPTQQQINFINSVNNAGGIAGVCRSIEDALNLIKQ